MGDKGEVGAWLRRARVCGRVEEEGPEGTVDAVREEGKESVTRRRQAWKGWCWGCLGMWVVHQEHRAFCEWRDCRALKHEVTLPTACL